MIGDLFNLDGNYLILTLAFSGRCWTHMGDGGYLEMTGEQAVIIHLDIPWDNQGSVSFLKCQT